MPRLNLAVDAPAKQRVTWTMDRGVLTNPPALHRCPMCGINPPGTPKKRVLQYVPPWVYFGFLMNFLVVLLLYFIARRRVDSQIPLCEDCSAAHHRGIRLRTLSVFSLFVLPVLVGAMGFGIGGDAGGAYGAASGLIASIVSMIVAHRRTATDIIQTRMIDAGKDGRVTLLASPSFGEVYAEATGDG